MMTAKEIINYMESLRNEEQRQVLMRFFKTGEGDYGEGDEFLGLKVPQTREVVKAVIEREQTQAGLDSAERKQARPKVKAIERDFPLEEVPELLQCPWHEVRLCGLLLLVSQFERLATKTLGHWLMLPTQLGDKQAVMDSLARSSNLWRQRMSMVSTWKTSQMGDASWCLRYAEMHLHHPHDLMHKAVGWMLREMGKRVSMDLLRDFLRQHAGEMPRTALRYAIEKMSDDERRYWMAY